MTSIDRSESDWLASPGLRRAPAVSTTPVLQDLGCCDHPERGMSGDFARARFVEVLSG